MPIARNQILVTIDGVKELLEEGVAFQCRYELVGFTDDGKPRYQCIYLREGEPEAILVSTRVGKLGPEPRYFNIWPGLFKHHHEFGDGRDLRFGPDYSLTLEERS
ncbi:hypothetical protein [Arenibacterium sp. LLYu02]|uniref:hypothetical protein n=1 Tax=Arenibacterium sp. LLYu02 TaxID=3404132 RepID=UPI003B20FFFA